MVRRSAAIAFFVIGLSLTLSNCEDEPVIPSPLQQDTITPRVLLDLEVDQKTELATVVLTAFAGAVTYRSSDSTVVRVESNGVVTARRQGTARVTVRSQSTPTLAEAVQIRVHERGTHAPQAINDMINEVCPNEDENAFRGSRPIASNLQPIHEFHDCQRLIRNGSYTALAGIFAHRNVADEGNWSGGRLAALIINFKTKGDTTRYTSLGLGPGSNCLILRSVGNGWEAAIIHIATSTQLYQNCPDSLNWQNVTNTPLNRRTLLSVQVQSGFNLKSEAVVPPVARWDWDPVNRLNYIGSKCGPAWCEVGPQGFTRSQPRLAPTGTPIIKGYYDEQYLADASGAVSRVFGTVMPGDSARDNEHHRRNGEWDQMAQMRLRADDVSALTTLQLYRDLFRLSAPATLLDPTVNASFPTSIGDLKLMSPASAAPDTDFSVQLSGVAASGVKAKFRSHPSTVNRFPTARWRWLGNDETIWTYCYPAGCCEVEGFSNPPPNIVNVRR
jgi:hypothetical protein